jgi:colanic acid biosynthesis glycosyl transferase WcaI
VPDTHVESSLAPFRSAASGPNLLVISQVYVPDPAAVGQYIADVGEEMVRRGWRVCVYTASHGYDDPTSIYPSHELRNGVNITRLPWSSFGKRSIAVRLLGQTIFLIQAFLRGLLGPRPSLILVSTSPPFAGFVGMLVAWLRGAELAWWVMDINPDQLIAAGKLSPASLFTRVFEWMNRVTLGQATAVITLDSCMAERLQHKLPAPAPPAVVPPWPIATASTNSSTTNSFRTQHGLEGMFVVMYSGNHALQHPLDTLLDAARVLENDSRVVFVFIGGGAGKAVVDARISVGAPNLRSLPPQPLEILSEVLTAADIHVVTMGNDMVGIVHPSKIYSAMGVGKPILFFGPTRSAAAKLVSDHQVGWVVNHGDTSKAVAAICAATSEPSLVGAMGQRAADVMATTLSAKRLRDELCDRITRAGATAACATRV